MKISRIDIVGFKSFPERTQLVFSEGISAVVGPNGCGKSNIVDAFRWVMGEQSAKQLRGRQMDDILFNGSEVHQPAGFAEVALTLTNDNGSEHPSFKASSEIKITRRLFRSGDSEYLINDVPCRLKDIIQLLMDAGMGTKAYSIVEQGRIGAAVDLKPEERRLLIDEAAGITRYKAQKKEAERKIEATEQNLVHINTLMAETKRQLNSITRASKKAARYQKMKAELKNIDLSLASIQMKELEEKQSDLMQKREELQARFMAHLARVEKIEIELETIRLTIAEQEKVIETKADRLYGLKSEFSNLQQEKDFIQDQIGKNRSRQDALTRELARMKEQHQVRKDELTRIRKDIDQLTNELESQKTEQFASHSDFVEINKKYNSAVTRKDDLSLELSEHRARFGRLEEIIAAHDRMAHDQAQRRAEITTEIEKYNLELEPLKEQIQKSNQKIEDLLLSQQEIQVVLDKRREELKSCQEKRESLDQKERRLESDLARVSSRLATLKDIQANFGWYSAEVQALMRSEELKAAGVIGPLAEQIEIPDGYEAAWEAALGERLQYILVKERSAVKTALHLLKNKKLGRCGFISLSDLGPDAQSDLTRALLGDYKLVNNLDEALAVEPGHTVLTRDGLYIGQYGLIVGGLPREKEQGLLIRRQEIENLVEQIENFKNKKNQLNILIQEQQHKIRGLTDSITEEERHYREVNSGLVEAEKRFSALKARQKEVESHLAALAQGLGNRHAEAERLAADKEAAQEEQKELEETIYHLKVELENVEDEVNRLADKRERSREKQQEITLRINTLDGRMKTLQLDERRTVEWLTETEAIMESKSRDLQGTHLEAKNLRSRHEEIIHLIKGFEERLLEAEKDIACERDRADSLRAELNIKENKLRQERKQREEINEQLNSRDLDIQEVVLKRQNLLERIENDYNLNLAAQPEELMPQLEPGLDPVQAKKRRDELKAKIEGMGEVNLTAIKEEEALRERYDFYKEQYDDLVTSIENLKESIARINRTCKVRFNSTFRAVDEKLREIFPILFEGGEAWLALTDEQNPLDCGVEIHVHPPGKKLTVMSLLSGGEKAMVALALIFALYLIKPSPFCLLDEIDAPLDEASIDRFNRLLSKLGQSSQIILVTHNKRTMQIAETLYGVTMEEPGISKMVRVNLSEVEEKLGNDQMVQAS